jgi:hypothetical protein
MKFYCVAAVLILTNDIAIAAYEQTSSPAVGVRLPVLGTSRFGASRFGIAPSQGFTVRAVVTGGSGSLACQSPVALGGTSICTVMPQGGNTLAGFSDNGSDRLSAVDSIRYVITNVTADHTVTATFSSPVSGACGSSNGSTFTTPPAGDLCSSGAASAVTGSGPWNWSCTGLNGGSLSLCSAFKDSNRIMAGQAGTSYLTLQDAYNAAADRETIFAQATSFTETLYCSKKIRVKLSGGRDASYAATRGFTTIRGALTIRNGRVDISGFVLK